MRTGIVRRRVMDAGWTGPRTCPECGEHFHAVRGSACPQCGQRAVLAHLGVIDAHVELHNGTRLLVHATRDPSDGRWVPTCVTEPTPGARRPR